jgi:MoaA/NifB/PqqE/SkfB family radical SAM enzyme
MLSQLAPLLAAIDGHPLVVWGARMTGLGFARFLAAQGQRAPVAFVDSDTALQGRRLNGIPVRSPQTLPDLRAERPGLKVVIAVALKEREIIEALARMGFGEGEYVVYAEYCSDFYTIDVVGSCNLKCPSCAHGSDGMESPKGSMPLEQFRQVVDKALRDTGLMSHVSLYSWGEPLIHPYLNEMIGYLHEKGIAAAVSSNLSTLHEKPLERLIQANPEYLKVSTSGYYPEVYDTTHTGGDVNLVKSNLYRLRFLIDKYQASTLVDVNYHLYTNNCGRNLRKMQELCAELGFSLSTTYALVMPLERVIDHCDGRPNPQLDNLRQLLLVDIDEGIEASKGVTMKGCPFRDNQLNINWDLSVPLCCTVFNRNPATMLTDNYLDTSLDDINALKAAARLCDHCTELGLPAYNMGFNRARWAEYAAQKRTTDD